MSTSPSRLKMRGQLLEVLSPASAGCTSTETRPASLQMHLTLQLSLPAHFPVISYVWKGFRSEQARCDGRKRQPAVIRLTALSIPWHPKAPLFGCHPFASLQRDSHQRGSCAFLLRGPRVGFQMQAVFGWDSPARPESPYPSMC